jgi:hypothetical protein
MRNLFILLVLLFFINIQAAAFIFNPKKHKQYLKDNLKAIAEKAKSAKYIVIEPAK